MVWEANSKTLCHARHEEGTLYPAAIWENGRSSYFQNKKTTRLCIALCFLKYGMSYKLIPSEPWPCLRHVLLIYHCQSELETSKACSR